MWVPLMPLNAVLFPGMPLPLTILEERYVRMVAECLESGEPFGVALIRSGPEVGGVASPHKIGTIARIARAVKVEGALQLIVVGQERFRVNDLNVDRDLLRADVSLLEPKPGAARVSGELCGELTDMLTDLVRTVLQLMGVPDMELSVPEDPERLSFMIAAHLTSPLEQRQQLLELDSPAERLVREREMLRVETEQYHLLLAAFQRAAQTQSEELSAEGPFSRN
jgi:uncharacterized protein